MSKSIVTAIDENGNVTTDFSGFGGDACIEEEERLRRELASLGLTLHVRPGTTRRHQDHARASQTSTNRTTT